MIRIMNEVGSAEGVSVVCDRTNQRIAADSVKDLRREVAAVERGYVQAVDRAQADLARFRAFGAEVVAAADERLAQDRKVELERARVDAEAAAARYALLKAAADR